MLEDVAAQRVVILGLALDWCVKETALDAAKDYETSVIPDASASVVWSPGTGNEPSTRCETME